ncbi:unnamed protein product [Symbiodinium necroappetens]|uniref:Secreted protein n=1 Tax=Symbiodinium necroappetens TaxID=1628268 RepID=A0A812K347_9DINO|nr:unnamed protein product [Symbiodinium necroappetens]
MGSFSPSPCPQGSCWWACSQAHCNRSLWILSRWQLWVACSSLWATSFAQQHLTCASSESGGFVVVSVRASCRAAFAFMADGLACIQNGGWQMILTKFCQDAA